MKFKIRPAKSKDIDALTELARRTFIDTFEKFNTPENMESYLRDNLTEAQHVQELADPSRRILMMFAGSGNGPIAYANLKLNSREKSVTDPKPIEIVRIYVDKDWHGKGAAQVLMQACLDLSVQLKFRTLWLGVWEDNFRARAFYKKFGMAAVGAHPFQLGDDLQTDIIMVKNLG